jgi:hypothetical protein
MSKVGCLKKIAVVAVCLLSLACEEEVVEKPVKVEPVPGKVEIFNSCGILNAATEARNALRANGFDVLTPQTDPQWLNYEETIVAIRNPHWTGYSKLKAYMNTENFIILQDALSGNVDATVFLGKDYKKALKIKRGDL